MKEKMAIVAAAKYAMNDEERSVVKKAWLDGYEAAMRWHRIPEVLPEQNQAVLTWSEQDGIHFGLLIKDFFYEDELRIKIAPTHWISIPEVPRER